MGRGAFYSVSSRLTGSHAQGRAVETSIIYLGQPRTRDNGQAGGRATNRVRSPKWAGAPSIAFLPGLLAATPREERLKHLLIMERGPR